jgi:hypothetical protein
MNGKILNDIKIRPFVLSSVEGLLRSFSNLLGFGRHE